MQLVTFGDGCSEKTYIESSQTSLIIYFLICRVFTEALSLFPFELCSKLDLQLQTSKLRFDPEIISKKFPFRV